MNIGIVSVLYREKGFPPFEVPPNAVTVGVINDASTFQGSLMGVDHVISNGGNLGFGPGVRQGVNYLASRGCTHILIINPDTQVPGDVLERLIDGMKRHRVDIVQPVILCADGRTINSDGNTLSYLGISTCRHHGSRELPSEDRKIVVASGACVFMTMEAWKKVDGFDDEMFLYQEDTDLSWRAALLGMNIYCIADAFCIHDYKLTLPSWKLRFLERNRLIMLLQNYQWSTLFVLLPLGVLFECGMLVYSLYKGFFLEKLWGYGEVLWRIPHILKRRAWIQSQRLISDRELLQKMDQDILEPSLQNILVKKILNPLLRWYYRWVLGIVNTEQQ